MKILYELEITKETGFTASDFPDHFKILREGKDPLVFKPVSLQIQDLYNRLNEAESLLKKASDLSGASALFEIVEVEAKIDQYFERHIQ